MLTQKSRRCYHRVMSGLERGGVMRVLTLTSSPQSPQGMRGLQSSWRKLYYRVRRRGLVKGYIRVPEIGREKGMIHLHVLFRGSYIEQVFLSKLWAEIHNAPVVYIQRVNGKAQLASYMAKYMAKEGAGHSSWSWGWVWKGFCRDWSIYKRWWWKNIYVDGRNGFSNLLIGWKLCLRGLYHFDFKLMAGEYPPSLCIT